MGHDEFIQSMQKLFSEFMSRHAHIDITSELNEILADVNRVLDNVRTQIYNGAVSMFDNYDEIIKKRDA